MSELNPFYPYTAENIHSGFSIDCVIFAFHKKKIRILLSTFDSSRYWQLPGGFMFKTERAEEAARRILSDRTGLNNIYLKQFYLFSDPNRTPKEKNIDYIKYQKLITSEEEEEAKKWFLQRFVSLGYYALVKYDEVKLAPISGISLKWFDLSDLPSLYSDHKHIIDKSLESIGEKLPILPVGYELLPDKFTMSELRIIYETFLGKSLDRRNFQRKVLASNIVVQLDEIRNTSPYNPPILYSFGEGKKDMVDTSSLL